MNARFQIAGMPVAKLVIVQTAAKRRQHVFDFDLSGGSRQSVAARLSARRFHKPIAAQGVHKFCDVGNGEALGPRNLRNGNASVFARPPNGDEAAKSVLFLRAEFHNKPRASFASSLILSIENGGSQDSSTAASATPGVLLTASSISWGSVCATGQFGEVSVITTLTVASSCTSTS